MNGPPGTGKTTLLRDIVAALVTERAEAMASFDDPDHAFEHSGQRIRAGNAWLHLYTLSDKLRGFEMLVASSNNRAVENVSAELPGLDAIAADAANLRYFKTVSDALLGRAWGLVSSGAGQRKEPGANPIKSAASRPMILVRRAGRCGSYGLRLPSMRVRLAICLSLAAAVAGCGNDSQQSFTAQVHTARVATTRIAWYERGQGPPLVMLTGTGSTMAEWDPALLRMLARAHRLILFDYPGVGLSGPWHGNSFDSLADTTAGLMKAIGVPKADVLGWSMGGFVAQRLAVDHPERVSHLILAATNPGGSQTVLGSPRAQAIDSKPNPSDRDILRELYPPDRQAEGRQFLRRLERASQSGEIPDDFDVPAATTHTQVAAEDPWLSSNRNYRQLTGISAPTLATAGRRDPVVPPVNLRRIAAQIPRSKLVIFPGAHAFLFQQRRSFARAVNELLSASKSD